MNKIVQVNFVTHDLEKAKQYWSLLLGREPDAEYHIGDFGEQQDFLDGNPVDCSDVQVIKYVFGGSIEDMLKGRVSIKDLFFLAFWKPGNNDTPWKRFLDEHGEGIMDLEMLVENRNQVYQVLGIDPYHIGMFPNSTYSFIHTKEKLLVDLNITQDEDNTSAFERMEGGQ